MPPCRLSASCKLAGWTDVVLIVANDYAAARGFARHVGEAGAGVLRVVAGSAGTMVWR